MEKRISPLDNVIDFREFSHRIISNWYYFLLSIIISLAIAFGYIRYSHEQYKSSIKVIIKKSGESESASEILYKNITDNKSFIKDEIKKFSSFPLVYQTVEDLRFDVSYFIVGSIKTSEVLSSPIIVSCDLSITTKNPVQSFEVKILDDDKFNIYNQKLELNSDFYFGEKITINNYEFVVNKNSEYPLSEEYSKSIFKFSPIKKVAKNYQAKIKIEPLEKESNIFSLFVLEEDQDKGVNFLNKLVENHIKNDEERRRASSLNTVNFITNEIQLIEDSLSIIEMNLQEYKNSHNIPDINLKTQSIYKKISELETELSSYKYQDKYYQYLDKYLNNGDTFDEIIAPSTYGITNASLNELIRQLVSIQLEKNILIDGGQTNNPSISDFDIQISQLSKNIKELIVNSKNSNRAIISDLNNRISNEETSLSFLPTEQRELLNIVRIQETSESLYTFLLQKKSEAEINASSISSNIEIHEPAMFFSKPAVFPNAKQTFSIAILLGFLIPLLVLLLLDVINDKIQSRLDLEKITDIDLIGVIGRNHSANNLLTKLGPKSSIAEGFRALRSNLNYKDKEDKVYLLTSSISGEGKTFIASNLSIVFANAGYKTLLLGADLRRPKLYEDFDTDNSKGLSTILDAEHTTSECTLQNVTENLDVISSGPLPSNPSDIFLNENFEQLINELKNKYDKIVIDTAPIGLVADAYMVMKHTDVNLFVVRQNFTSKDLLKFVNDLYKNNRIENLSLVLNDVSTGSGVYGYGKYSYGYGYGYGGYTHNSDYFEEN
ncbi:MAG: polysaccharide biosynthesis tyrosine autokinase [Flavobacteriales bacterium]|nr:polysaccharide biosynthesis tyrosine autokinase [Flavobacteriales bacterium]